jgi:hypothetical protein
MCALDDKPLLRDDGLMNKAYVLKLTRILSIALSIIASSLIFSPRPALGETLIRIMPLGNQAVITVHKGYTHGSDRDAQTLFMAMNVQAQESYLGPGKFIAESQKSMNWVCGDRGTSGYQCTFMIQKSAFSRIGTNPDRVSYELIGAEALRIFEMLHPTNDEVFQFQNEESSLFIESTPARFKLEYR